MNICDLVKIKARTIVGRVETSHVPTNVSMSCIMYSQNRLEREPIKRVPELIVGGLSQGIGHISGREHWSDELKERRSDDTVIRGARVWSIVDDSPMERTVRDAAVVSLVSCRAQRVECSVWRGSRKGIRSWFTNSSETSDGIEDRGRGDPIPRTTNWSVQVDLSEQFELTDLYRWCRESSPSKVPARDSGRFPSSPFGTDSQSDDARARIGPMKR